MPPQTILLVEDEPTLQKTLSLALENEGYTVQKALDGETGIKTARETKPDLILLDLVLPKMDGFEALAELKKDEVIKEIPVIVLINLENPQDIEKATSLGAADYVVKALYDLKEVIAKIKEILK